ncbi:MAG: tetratricopeptide repeat protein [Bacteroidota bacterium]
MYFKALSLSEAKSTKTVGDLYHNIGMIYFNQKLHDSALVYANRALAVREASGYEVGKGMSYMNIGNVYQDLGNHEQALTYFQKTLDIYSKTENDLWAANVYGNMGNTFRDSGDYEEAIKAYREAEKRFVEIGNKASLSRLNWAIGNTYYLWKKPDKAEPFCLKADKLALQIKSKENQLLACDCLYGVYKDLGQLAEAMKYGERFVLLQDSIRLQSIANRLANQETKYAYEKELLADSLAYVQQAAALQNEVREQQTQRNIVIGALLAGAIILLLVWRSYRQNKRANEELEKKNQTIRLALEERETLLKEIHHRVKNNLQVVSSLLSLQSRGLQNDEAQQALQEGQNRVRAMALIHQNLYQEGNLVGVDVPAYVGKLVQTLVQSYKIDTQQVEIDLDISPITLDVDTLIPLGLIINELVTNALKYAFKEGQQGKLVVGIGQTSEALILSVKDNGPGLPEGFDMKQGSSMGFRLVQAFSRKMKATVEVKNEGGALIELTIPHPKSLKA